MSRSHRKHCKFPICCVGTEGMRKWKRNCRQERRAKEKAQMNGIVQDEEGYDEETCTPVKYQKDKNMSDWNLVLTMATGVANLRKSLNTCLTEKFGRQKTNDLT